MLWDKLKTSIKGRKIEAMVGDMGVECYVIKVVEYFITGQSFKNDEKLFGSFY